MGLMWRMVYKGGVRDSRVERERKKPIDLVEFLTGGEAEVLVKRKKYQYQVMESCCVHTCIIGTDCSGVQGG